MTFPLAGQRAVEMVKCPAIQEQPIQTAIANARNANRALQQASVRTRALAQQQDVHALLMQHLGLVSSAAGLPSSSTSGVAQRAQQGNAAERSPGSASSSQQQASGSADAQHAQQGQNFESAEAKHAQQGADAPARQLPGKAGDGRLGQTDKPSPAHHDGDHSQHHVDHAQLNRDRAQAGQQATDAEASASTSASTDSNGTSRQHSTTPQHSTPPKPGSSRAAQPDTHQHEPASSDSMSPSQNLAPAPATSSTKQDHSSSAKPQNTTTNSSHIGPQPQPAVTSQQQPQTEAQAQDVVQGLLTLQSMQPMPASLPPMDDLRCVLGNGEQISMLDGLQALMTGFTITMLTNQVSISIGQSCIACKACDKLAGKADLWVGVTHLASPPAAFLAA